MAEDGGAEEESDRLAQLNDYIRQRMPEEPEQGSQWLALESSPEVLNVFGARIGLPAGWEFVDVVALDEVCLEWVPRPVAAVILLFPCTRRIYDARRVQHQALRSGRGASKEGLFFLKQVEDFGNACGTIACLHAISNCRHVAAMAEGALLEVFVREHADATPEERGRDLLKAKALKGSSDAAATCPAAQTACPARDGPALDHHFAAFVRTPGGRLVELDGTKLAPVDHGPTDADGFLADASRVIRRDFIDVEPDVHGFVVMALARTPAS